MFPKILTKRLALYYSTETWDHHTSWKKKHASPASLDGSLSLDRFETFNVDYLQLKAIWQSVHSSSTAMEDSFPLRSFTISQLSKLVVSCLSHSFHNDGFSGDHHIQRTDVLWVKWVNESWVMSHESWVMSQQVGSAGFHKDRTCWVPTVNAWGEWNLCPSAKTCLFYAQKLWRHPNLVTWVCNKNC